MCIFRHVPSFSIFFAINFKRSVNAFSKIKQSFVLIASYEYNITVIPLLSCCFYIMLPSSSISIRRTAFVLSLSKPYLWSCPLECCNGFFVFVEGASKFMGQAKVGDLCIERDWQHGHKILSNKHTD